MMEIFLGLGAVGIVLVLVVLIFGDLLDAVFGVGAFSAFDSDIFSTAGIAGLIGGFGFGGALGLNLSGQIWVGVVTGIVVGVLLGWIAGKTTAFLRKSESGYSPSNHNLIGVEGKVLTPIPVEGYGQIRVNHAGHLLTLNAKSDIALSAGTTIWISGVISGTSVEVTPVHSLPSS